MLDFVHKDPELTVVASAMQQAQALAGTACAADRANDTQNSTRSTLLPGQVNKQCLCLARRPMHPLSRPSPLKLLCLLATPQLKGIQLAGGLLQQR
jgi:hypothetical protein